MVVSMVGVFNTERAILRKEPVSWVAVVGDLLAKLSSLERHLAQTGCWAETTVRGSLSTSTDQVTVCVYVSQVTVGTTRPSSC